MIRIQLIGVDSGKSLTIRKGDPIGINNIVSELKRSKNNDGVVRQVVIDIPFIKRGRTFVKDHFENWGGPDAKVICNIFRLVQERDWVLYATGQINFSNYQVTEDTLTVDIEQTGFQRLVENSMSIPVDLSTNVDVFGRALPAQAPIDLPLHAKTILKTYQKTGYEEVTHLSDDGSIWFVPGSGIGTLALPTQQEKLFIDDEITKKSELSAGISDSYPIDINLYVFKLDVGGSYRIKIDAQFTINCAGKTVDSSLKLVYGKPGAYTVVNVTGVLHGVGLMTSPVHFDQTYDLEAGDEVYYFASTTFSGGGGPAICRFNLSSLSYPDADYFMVIKALTKAGDSVTKAHLMFEAVKRTVQFYTGQEDCLESPLLGRTDLGYDEDGQGSLIAVTNGNNIRLVEKPITSSLQDLVGINDSLYGIGMGYKTVNGVQKLIIDTKDKFYNKNLRALNLGKVYNVRRRLDINRLFNQIQFGFNYKIDLDQINATDAFNTIRNYVLPLRNSKNKLDFSTTVKADGYQIEYQRGLINKTNDGKLDDDNFIIQCIRDGGGFKAKKDEGYDLITGVIDPASGYNYDISPARCVRNWLKYIAASLIYSGDKNAQFASGTVNYELATQKAGEELIKENDPVSLFGIDPIWTPFVLECETQKLECADFEELVEKSLGYVEFQDNFGATFKGFIDEGVKHNPTTLEASFSLLEMFQQK